MNRNNKYLTLVRREFWENRNLWITPLIGVGLLLCAAIWGAANIGNGITISTDPVESPARATEIGAVSLLGISSAIGLFACIVTGIYLLDCLFAERKDRSILFWKSLPVSDAETVLAKLGLALVLMPLFVLALSVLLQPVLALIVGLRFSTLSPHIGGLLWGSLKTLPYLMGVWFATLLWYAPVATYLMLASVIAKRTPIVYAIVPPVALGVAEWLLFDTRRVFLFVAERLVPQLSQPRRVVPGDGPMRNGSIDLQVNWGMIFSDPGLWLGLLAAAAMAYGVIRLRRYRDDT
jgi:ABC-2 type transport system permease protein